MTTPRISARVVVPVAVGLATLGGFGAGALFQPGAAGAQTSDSTSTTTKATDAATAKPADCMGKAPLDEATADKVKAAALKAVPGATVNRVGPEKRTDGYVAMLTKADGTTRVLVHLDKDFKVTKVEDPAPARGPRGHGPGGMRGSRIAPERSTTST